MAQIRIENVRLAFPELWQPRQINGGTARYSACFIIDPKSPNVKVINDAMVAAAKEKFGDKAAAVLAKLKAEKRVPLRTEERVDKDGQVYAGFEGMYSLNASNKVKPLVIDANKSPLSEQDGRPYGGCYVNAVVDIWAQNNPDPKIGRRINCTLLGVQFVRDGDAFGSARVASPDAFDLLAGDNLSDLT